MARLLRTYYIVKDIKIIIRIDNIIIQEEAFKSQRTMLSFIISTRLIAMWIFTTAASRASTEHAYDIRTRLIVDSGYDKRKERRRGDKAFNVVIVDRRQNTIVVLLFY